MNIERIIPILLLLVTILIGLVDYLFKLNKVDKKIQLTTEYLQKFTEYTSGVLKNKFNQELYVYLTENVGKMQTELGSDGIVAYMQDELAGIAVRNYQLLVNTLPATKDFYRNEFTKNEIARQRIASQCDSCSDSFIRHKGNLKNIRIEIKQLMKKPINLFSNGISSILSAPFVLLKELKIISDDLENSIIKSRKFKFLDSVLTLIAFISDVVSIITGWNNYIGFISRF